MIEESTLRIDVRVDRLGIILEPNGSDDEIEGVLNPAVARGRNGELIIYPRVVARGNTSRVGLVRATQDRGTFNVQRLGYALEPTVPYELRSVAGGQGCEDPRVTYIPIIEKFVMAYTAFGPAGPRVALALSDDGMSWTRLGLVQFVGEMMQVGDDKDAAFFPEPVHSPSGVLSLAFYHRPMLHISAIDGHSAIPTILSMDPDDRESTRIAYVPLEPVMADINNLLVATESVKVLTPDAPWGRIKNGAGTPPVRTKAGWLSFFHAVDAIETEGKPAFCYSAGIVVHDKDEPHRVLYRSPQPVLAPDSHDERVGIVNNVVFPTGIDVQGPGVFDVYYGAADAKVGRARVNVDFIDA